MVKSNQPTLTGLGNLCVVTVEDLADRVILRAVNQQTGHEHCRLEFTPEEADLVAGHLLSAATKAMQQPAEGNESDG